MLIPPPITPIPIVTPATSVIPPAAATESSKKSRQHDQHDQQGGSAEQGRQELGSGNQLKSTQELNNEEQAEVQRLTQRDREVRAHEAAHKAAAGRYARGGPNYEYEKGPDGRQYAVGGEVDIDVSRPKDPYEALQKALQVQRAAMAPAQPSAQDRAVASEAAQMANEARAEIRSEKSTAATDEATTPVSAQGQSLEQAYKLGEIDDRPHIDISV